LALTAGVLGASDGRAHSGGTPTGRFAIPRHPTPGPPTTTPSQDGPGAPGTNALTPPQGPPSGPPPQGGPSGEQQGLSPFEHATLPPLGSSDPYLPPTHNLGDVNLTQSLSVDSVPEPGSMLLIGAGIAAYSVRRWRARRNRA
jgi:hypothetical protein